MHVVHPAGSPPAPTIAFGEFLAVDVRAGTIREALPFPEARKPSYILKIDFGPTIGMRRSSAQITHHYALSDLPGRRVMAVVNLEPRQVGPVRSEVLVLGFPDSDGEIFLAQVDADVPDGARLA